jgi:nucleotide-binding universal stress UspA family protein
MQNIVIGVDGSPASQQATEVGLQLAAGLGAQVTFVHFSPLADKLYQEDPDNGPSQKRLEEADEVLRRSSPSGWCTRLRSSHQPERLALRLSARV